MGFDDLPSITIRMSSSMALPSDRDLAESSVLLVAPQQIARASMPFRPVIHGEVADDPGCHVGEGDPGRQSRAAGPLTTALH
jgi:hypothetical protein